jgi:hypothetical protein
VIVNEIARRLEVLVSVLRSVARRQLVKTDNRSVCITVNWILCKSATTPYLCVTKRICNQGANKSNHPNWNPFIFVTRATLDVTLRCF